MEDWPTGCSSDIGDATFRQMIRAGTTAPDEKLQAAVAGQRCKPANRRQRQLCQKVLVTEQEEFEAHQTEDRGSSSAGRGREIVA